MTNDDQIVREMMEKVSEDLAASLKESIAEAVQKEISKSMSKTLLEGEFYRRINIDLQNGLRDIYHEVAKAKKGPTESPVEVCIDCNPDDLFTEASDQLDAIMRTTEKATQEIMDIVEKLQETQLALIDIIKSFESGGVKKEQRVKLSEINSTLSEDLMTIMTTLSFQDLTGQRIKIIIDTIKSVEKIVLDLYMSTGLKIKAREEAPEKSLEQLDKETQSKMSDLKGPTEKADQNNVDDLLASLGL
ncbi:protein phosphatase CheZ [Maridesulfovibrio hydrothermalis]|uniref:Putative chemotaxis phosphatase, CheZ n=1 Tax=Maridesulfovibrio hydrothermalis AM13 = DSM 14728 TaxID=1121451 RepID=L0RE80_9BACT|nr:protein phosphatase CheZ [Maridesulfovibrio hydrothermalis]CCO24512.1 putative chemotaxis phosphatase, CheZ [Maridesulfovibrio hydrothermalis AM13 = DSM 14728]